MGPGALTVVPSAAQLGVVGYGLAAFANVLLALLLSTLWRVKMKGSRLLPVAIGSVLWAAVLALAAAHGSMYVLEWSTAEALRFGLWFAFLIGVLSGSGGNVSPWLRIGAYGGAVLLATTGLLGAVGVHVPSLSEPNVLMLVELCLSILGLLLLEQVMRFTRQSQEWRVKLLWVACGVLFAYDLFFLSLSFLFRKLNLDLWLARGYVNALVVALLAVGIVRVKAWQTRIFMSPALAFYTTSIAMAGLYLLVMAVVGYYLRAVGGEWGAVLEIVFLAAAVMGLAGAVLFGFGARLVTGVCCQALLSLQIRLPQGVARADRTAVRRQCRIAARRAHGRCLCPARQGERRRTLAGRERRIDARDLWAATMPEPMDPEFERFLAAREWVVDLSVARLDPTDGGRTPLVPEWLRALPGGWLVVPLLHESRLVAIVVLGEPLVPNA